MMRHPVSGLIVGASLGELKGALLRQPHTAWLAGLGLPPWGLQRDSVGSQQGQQAQHLSNTKPQFGPENTKGMVVELFEMLEPLSSVRWKADPLSPSFI